MIKVLAVVSLTAFLCCYGGQSAKLSSRANTILNSGNVVFIDFLEKVRNVTEKIVRDDQFRKSRIAVQSWVKKLREFAKPESASGSQDESDVIQKLFPFAAAGTFVATFKDISENVFFPYFNIYRQIFKNETMVEIWKEVESYYLPGAPPIYSKPMEFFSYLLAKAVVRSRLVNMLEAGVVTVLDIGKIDFNQLHEEVQMVMEEIRNKAFEISVLERQKEKNDFLISLRTTSGLIAFYWDEVLKHTESPSFHVKYLDSMTQWPELIKLRNASENYHVLLDPDTRNGLLKAIGKSAVVYSLPVYEKLSEVGFGITEINRFLNRVNNIILILEGKDVSRTHRQTYFEVIFRIVFSDLCSPFIEAEKNRGKDDQLLLPLRVIRTLFLCSWYFCGIREQYRSSDELQQSANEWNQVKSVVINELLKSEAFTREQLEEAPKNFIQAIHRILEKLKEYTDLNDDFEKGLIDLLALGFEEILHYRIIQIHEVWDMLVE
ncbi:unnamed protein product [Leuciscus chuanchicus]